MVSLPTYILMHHNNIEIYFQYMNRIAFLHTKFFKITFLTAENCISKITDKIIKYLDIVTKMYKGRFFNKDMLHRDNNFNLNSLIEHISPASLNICAK